MLNPALSPGVGFLPFLLVCWSSRAPEPNKTLVHGSEPEVATAPGDNVTEAMDAVVREEGACACPHSCCTHRHSCISPY